MTDNLLDTTAETAAIPAKFRDPESGALRLEALLKSYGELERKLARMVEVPGDDADDEAIARFRKAIGVPDAPDGYACDFKDKALRQDKELDARLHAAGFTPPQVQLVYDLATEYVVPLMRDMGSEFEAERQRQRLVAHFGSPEAFAEIARQVGAWGRKAMPAPAFEALASTFEGVLALRQMMETQDPEFRRGDGAAATDGQDELDRLMRDPRYWRQRDPELVAKVTDGFRRLFKG